MRAANFSSIITLMRPRHWVKNIFICAAIIFVKHFLDPYAVVRIFTAFIVFCAASSSVYIFNDIIDAPLDRQHPHKKNRPLAAGKISRGTATLLIFILLLLTVGGSVLLSTQFFLTTLAYIILNVAYTLVLKQKIILDVLAIALGFVIRVIAGAVVIAVTFSPWLIFSTFFLTLFLAISKRRSELLVDTGCASRPVLDHYTLPFLDHMNATILPLIVITYTFYTFNSNHSKALILTVPVVLYGLFRYLYILNNKTHLDDGPIDDVFRDKPLQASIIIWVTAVLCILIYGY